ncbi:hypothetical protein R3P38DRAFT_2826879 [Favolaschia claudopus]|uniref:PWI domain-containing protein n=1 Tax=Favolaschia claudopus TaxID=2862362 RepID=A0AAW0EKK5_9AGAR
MQPQKQTTLFTQRLNELLTACGVPQGFGFAEFEEPDGALRALALLNKVELPALEEGCANKNLQKLPFDNVVAEIKPFLPTTHVAKEKYVVPPHLHDLQEADLPETQRGLVISEIAQFRERAPSASARKMRELQSQIPQPVAAPSGPKMREWGRPKEEPPKQHEQRSAPREQGMGKGAQGYDKPVDFVRSGARISALERTIARQRQAAENEARDRIDLRARLEAWDDDESDEFFSTQTCARWRTLRARNLAAEQQADATSAAFEQEEAANLARESEDFLARQMGEMQALAEEQRRAGLLLDDGAPVRLSVSLGPLAAQRMHKREKEGGREGVFGAEEDEEEATRKRKVPLVKLDFSAAEAGPEATRERLESMKSNVPSEREALFKGKSMIDRKFEPLVKRLMTQYLGDAEEAEELIMFVVEHLKDHKGPAKLTEGLEPVLEEEAIEVTTASMAYGEGLHTDRMTVD